MAITDASAQLTFPITARPLNPSDLWCSAMVDPIWDGEDFSVCFRAKYLNGAIPLAFLILSFSCFLLISLYHLLLRFHRAPPTTIPLSSSSRRRLSIASVRARSRSRSRVLPEGPEASQEISTRGPRAITEAENEVILGLVGEESPDLLLADVLALGVGAPSKLSGSAIEDDDEGVREEPAKVTLSMCGKALRGTKKDMINVVGSAGLLACLIVKLLKEKNDEGSGWMYIVVAAWAWTVLLTVAKLAVSFSSRLHRLQHPSSTNRISPYYTLLEAHIIPFFLVYTAVSFLTLRSVFLRYLAHVDSLDHLKVEIGIFAISLSLSCIESFSSRPSSFSSRSQKPTVFTSTNGSTLPVSPEMHASLFGMATFSFIDPFMFKHAFPSASTPPLSMASVPDLRPDDKTARVLLGYRRDVALLNGARSKPFGLTTRLVWHFRRELLLQQLWGYIKVAVIALPPLCLRELLGHIAKRQKGEEAPLHVALLWAFLMFLFQNVGSIASSQSLYIGRRVCIRLRSIIIGEVYTKALRRKDMAGSTASPAADSKTDSDKPNKPPTDEELEKASSGKIVNLISVDTFRVSEVAAYLHFIWPELSLTIVIAVVLLFNVLGWSAIAGVGTLVILTPLQAAASRLFYKYQKRLLAAADARLALATEVIANVRVVKYFAWETKFIERMDETRRKELAALWSRALTVVAGGILMFGAPVIVSVTTFVFHTKVLQRDLDAQTAFTALALFNILRGPLEGFTDMIVSVLSAHVSLVRIDEFLNEEETAKYTNLRTPTATSDPVIGFSNDASFTWGSEDAAKEDAAVFRLHDLNLTFPVGKLSVVLGPVGSGKSTLLLSLLGETNKLSGHAFLPSPVIRASGENPAVLTDTSAYAAQSPWLISDTIKENILFGSPMNEPRYNAVLDACALEQDLKQFELGDLTEVGEKGTVLSGGQKARISLARAVYSSAKTVLLDDILSAVDSHTTQHLYHKCLKGKLMRHRTCVLVTHAVDTVLQGAAFVVSLDNGVVISSGAPADTALVTVDGKPLSALQPPEIDALASTITIESLASGIPDAVLDAKAEEEKRLRQERLKLVKDESQSVGMVSASVYLLYFKALGGWGVVAAILGIFFLAQLAEVGVSLALRYWAQSYDILEDSFTSLALAAAYSSTHRLRTFLLHPITTVLGSSNEMSTLGTGNAQTDYWLRVYVLMVFLNLALYGGRSAYLLWRGLVASRVIYADLVDSILGAPIRFFDSTPTGRILNRLSKDVETLDQDVAMASTFFILEIFGAIAIISTISTVLPIFLLAALGIIAVYWLIGFVYIRSSRELKRSESVTKSPIFSLFGESLNGVATIRAYGDAARFTKQVFSLININNRPFFTLWQVNRWLSVRIEFAGAAVVLVVAFVVLLARGMDAALAGFVLSFALNFNERMLWLIRLWSVVELDFNSIERVKEYLEIDQESKVGIAPPAAWPSRDGTIEVEGLTASYAADLPPVLKNVSFSVLPKEKVGICGRTGSGKSTLGLSFFRFIEPTSGRIVIDGIDINTLPLSVLRSRLTIVAQDTALFEATMRFNLDPFSLHDDAELWDALRRVQLARPLSTPSASRAPSRVPSSRNLEDRSDSEDTAVEREERFVVKSLDMPVSQGGKNFSAGQKQLISLARGILKLRTSSILILDESTASLDQATDERIQKTIRSEMADATIFCIAHRLRTIGDYDKILVLGAGSVLEFGTPWDLLEKEDSVYADLCRKSGEYDALVELAHARRDSLK